MGKTPCKDPGDFIRFPQVSFCLFFKLALQPTEVKLEKLIDESCF